MSVDDLKEVYEKFENEGYKWITSDETQSFFNHYLSRPSTYRRQFDLPYFIPSVTKSDKMIMILGMDAKASKKRSITGENDDILLSTPYNLHSKNADDKKYRDFADVILDRYNIYLTDIYKAYFIHDSVVSNKFPKYKSKGHKAILQAEIEILKPNYIITLGNDARDELRRLDKSLVEKSPTWDNESIQKYLYNEIKVISICHVAKSANGAIKTMLDQYATELIFGTNVSQSHKIGVVISNQLDEEPLSFKN